nr:dienelactone hydrolase family protein [uncultured Lichenicoccus sp.]
MTSRYGLDGLRVPSTVPLARRGFVMTSLMSGLTLAATRANAEPIHTNAAGLLAGEVQIPVADGTLPAYAARPEGTGPYATILVIEEIFGVHDYIKDICRRLAKAGYLAVAPELYARLGDLSKMTDPHAIVRDVISRAPDATVLTDLDSTATWATNSGDGDPRHLAVIGFCRGGRDTWLYAAHNPRLKAAIAWYGPLGGETSAIQPHNAGEMAGMLTCPLLGLYGGADPSTTPDEIHAAEQAARAGGRTVEIVVYPDTPHGFHADYRPSYRRGPAEDGWRRMLAWLHRNGVG